jgi:hypothetical protein
VGEERGATGLLFTVVRCADGQLRLTVDEVERQGRLSALTWRPYDNFNWYDFPATALQDRRDGKLRNRFEEIGSTILGRLDLQQELRRSKKRTKKKR